MAHAQKIAPESLEKILNFSPKMKEGFTSLSLEGIHLPDADLIDLHAFDQGQITKEDLISRALGRVKQRK